MPGRRGLRARACLLSVGLGGRIHEKYLGLGRAGREGVIASSGYVERC